MKRHTPMILTGLLLAAAACSGIDNGGTAPDVMDLTTSAAYRIPNGATISVSPKDARIVPGATVKLSTTVNSATGQTIHGVGSLAVTWVSSDTTIARVSSNGIVLGRSPGVVTVRAITGSQSAESKITVGVVGSTPVSSVDTAPAAPTTTTETTSSTATPPSSTPTQPTAAPTTPVASSQTQSNFQNAFLYDDFTRYHTTADLQHAISSAIGGTGSPATALYTDGHNPELASLDQSVLYNGHATVRYSQPAGTGATPQLWVDFPNGKTLTSFWYRVKIRYSPGWTTTGTITNSANSYKLLNWGWAGANGRGGVTITNTNQYQAYFYTLLNGSTLTAENDLALGTAVSEWTTGQWYDYIIQYQQSAPTVATVRVWISQDGQTPVLRGTIQGDSRGTIWPAVNRVTLGENFNQNRVQAQSLWIGEWSVFDGSKYANPYNVH